MQTMNSLLLVANTTAIGNPEEEKEGPVDRPRRRRDLVGSETSFQKEVRRETRRDVEARRRDARAGAGGVQAVKKGSHFRVEGAGSQAKKRI